MKTEIMRVWKEKGRGVYGARKVWRELNREAAVHGLAVTGGAISTTGVAGLTLGGGLGWLMSKYGLAADNVIEIQLVTADGRIVDVTESSDPDLFWALRAAAATSGWPRPSSIAVIR